jgi:hypothetical protein
MPNLYTTTNDGEITTGNESSWSNARDKTTGTVDDTSADATPIIFRSSGRGATTYKVGRFFMTFDTSGITGTVTAATLKLSMSGTNSSYIAIESQHSDPLVSGDFDNVNFSEPFSAEVSSSTGVVDFVLNSTFRANMQSEDTLGIAVVNYPHDYSDSAPTSDVNLNDNIKTTNTSGTSNDPYIEYTVATGYGNTVNGVAAASIGKINGVATASISKVNGI